ncbi:MAG: hypothetical protein HRT57_14640 [Crocinitomicaceae bacterium]|nr:hypothetical protein [Crocinitomicaceae bacterium]
MENFFLNLGFGWTSSKIIPFVLMVLFGITLYLIALKFSKEKWMRILSMVLILLPALTYLVINPIYEGDFANNYRIEKQTDSLSELENNRLTVLVLPGCPYCEEALEQLKILKSHIGSDQEIDIIVCTVLKNDLKYYKDHSEGKMNVRIAKNSSALSEIAGHQFPAFVYKGKGEKLRVWSNAQFGPSAKDWIEEKMQ